MSSLGRRIYRHVISVQNNLGQFGASQDIFAQDYEIVRLVKMKTFIPKKKTLNRMTTMVYLEKII